MGTLTNGVSPLTDEFIEQSLSNDSRSNLTYLDPSSSLILKRIGNMFYVPMDFGATSFDGLVDTGALTSAISQSDLTQIRLLSHEAILNLGPAPSFQIMLANGQL